MFDAISGRVGSVKVLTTEGRGFTPEELSEQALDKIVYVSGKAPAAIRDQAEAFRDNIRQVLVYYMHEAVRSRNMTVANKLTKAGYADLIPILDD